MDNLCQRCGKDQAQVEVNHNIGGQISSEKLCRSCFEESFGSIASGPLAAMMAMGDVVAGPATHPQPNPLLHEIIIDAGQLSDKAGLALCDTPQLLAALLRSEPGREALAESGLSDDQMNNLRQEVGEFCDLDMVRSLDQPPEQIRFTPQAIEALRIAQARAARERRPDMDPLCLVQGLLVQELGTAARMLRAVGATPLAPREGEEEPHPDTPALNHFGRDLTAEAADGKIDPVIGRAEEIEQAVEILARRRKNNAVLIGEPGVGKTAIVEGLALRIVNDDVPETIRHRRVVALDLASMVAGSQMRGEFEQRLKAVLDEVKEASGDIILFIDEIHTLVGAGAAEGAIDAANILKPMLARGELHVIGATTLREYKRVERDGALARRFSPVMIEETSEEETIEILQGLRPAYEAHHRALISDEAIEAAVKLSHRYISEYFLPDKAIDLIDQGSARARLRCSGDPEQREFDRKRNKLEAAKERAIAKEDFDQAGEIHKQLVALDKEQNQGEGEPTPQEVVTVSENDIAEVMASRTGIPVGELLAGEKERLQQLEDDLHARVVGQDQAVGAVSDAIRRARAGLAEPDRPLGSFLFLGPTGVGKTELAKTLAERLFATEKALIRLDMSEFRESHTVARLIGSPPGYVGYGEGGQLTEQVRRRPYSVILIDEIEKAHPEVWNTLLQVMDDGRLTDGEGNVVDFRNTVIIMTSNLGAGQAKRPLGFAQVDEDRADKQMLEAAKKAFLPEFLNRIDEIVIFDSLDEGEVGQIAQKICDELAGRLMSERQVTLTVDPTLVEKLAVEGFDPEYGARPLKRHLRRTLEKSLTDAILSGKLLDGGKVTAKPGKKEIKLSISKPRKK